MISKKILKNDLCTHRFYASGKKADPIGVEGRLKISMQKYRAVGTETRQVAYLRHANGL